MFNTVAAERLSGAFVSASCAITRTSSAEAKRESRKYAERRIR
jgi:hypothetical protein